MPLARADLESLLRARKLDRTLTTAIPAPPDASSIDAAAIDEYVVARTGVTSLDARLGGGFPRGQISEIVGARSSGRTSLLLAALARATARGEIVALVDALDMLDVASGEAAGIDLGRLLWIRGHMPIHPGPCRELEQRAHSGSRVDQAIKALTLVLQSGVFGMVAFDAGEAAPDVLGRLPFTTWLRLQRIIEGSRTACVLVGQKPIARSSAGLTLQLCVRDARWSTHLFDGLNIDARVVRARPGGMSRGFTDVCVPLSTACG